MIELLIVVMIWLMIAATVAICAAYHRYKKREFWLMERKWAREDREARLEQDRLDMEKALKMLKDHDENST